MDQRPLHIRTIMPGDHSCLGAPGLAQVDYQSAQLIVSHDQGLEIVGIDLSAGEGAEYLAEPGHDPLLGQGGVSSRLPVDTEDQHPARL